MGSRNVASSDYVLGFNTPMSTLSEDVQLMYELDIKKVVVMKKSVSYISVTKVRKVLTTYTQWSKR